MSALRVHMADTSEAFPAWLPAAVPFPEGERLFLASDGAAPLAALRACPAIPLLPLRCWLHLGWRVRTASELSLCVRQAVLQLGQDHVGAAEVRGFNCAPGLPAGRIRECAAALLDAALAWLRTCSPARPTRIVAGVPGARQADASAPFWRGLGALLCGAAEDVEALRRWPGHAIEVAMLDATTRAAIGSVHPAAEPWRAALHAAGLRPGQHIDPFDGGPVYEAPFDRLVD